MLTVKFDKADDKTALQAKYDAQKIAFAPIVFQATKTLRDLGILDALFDNRQAGLSALEVADKLQLPIYGVKVLLEAGLGAEVCRAEEQLYHITKTGYFILKDDLTTVNMNFVHDVCYEGMFDLTASITDEKPTGLKVFGTWNTVYEALSSLPEPVQKSWFDFDHYYSDRSFPEALPLVFAKDVKHLVDVGGNTGKWAIQCLKYNYDVKVTILDLPGQLDKAKANLDAEGYSDRVDTMAVNLLEDGDDFPENVDAVWMSQFLDCFSLDDITRILKRARKGMSEKSSLYIMENFWDRQRFEAAAFSLVYTSLYFTNIANGNSKMYHSDEVKQCASDVGLRLVNQIDDIGLGHTLLEYKLADCTTN
jgi:hypothetical protein